MITIDLDSDVPLEEQIHRELRHAIAAGVVLPGDRLPSARQLAADLSVHWNTVSRAYRRLADEGLAVVGRGRQVTVRHRAGPPRESDDLVAARLRELVTEARLAGWSRSRLEKALNTELTRWEWRPEG